MTEKQIKLQVIINIKFNLVHFINTVVSGFEANFLEPSVKKELLAKYVDKCSFSPLFVHLRNNILNKTNG